MSNRPADFIGDARNQINDPDPDQTIETACNRAIQMASMGATAINRVMGESGHAARLRRFKEESRHAFLLYFSVDVDNTRVHLRQITSRLRKVNERIRRGPNIKVRPATGPGAHLCADGFNAFQAMGPAGRRRFSLCPNWFTFDPEAQAAILLHEMLHAAGLGGFTDDQENAANQTVRDDLPARQFAMENPIRARRNPENYEHFYIYLAERRNARIVGRNGWRGVDHPVDAALAHPTNGKIYFFKHDRYQRYVVGQGVEKNGVVGRDGWNGISGKIDAVVVHPINGKIYFFQGNRYRRYVVGKGAEFTGTIGDDGWKGLLGNFDAAYVNPVDGMGYFLKGIRYEQFDFGADRRSARGTLGDGDTPQLRGYLDAAIVHPTNGDGYFFIHNTYYRYNFSANPPIVPLPAT